MQLTQEVSSPAEQIEGGKVFEMLVEKICFEVVTLYLSSVRASSADLLEAAHSSAFDVLGRLLVPKGACHGSARRRHC